jgi:peroxiredoxin
MNKTFKTFVLLGSLLLSPLFSKALPTFIKGKLLHTNQVAIRLSTYTDLISFQEEILDQQTPDEQGNFQLGFEVNSIQEVFVKLGNQSFSFYAEAGKTYEIQIDNIEIPPRSLVSEHKTLHIQWAKENLLNEAIDNFNYAYSSFLEKHFVEIYKYRDVELLKSFEKDMLAQLKQTTHLNKEEHLFFENYIQYQLADLKNASNTIYDLSLGKTYLENKTVLYKNPVYMQFFNAYFSKYFVSGKRNTDYHEFIDLIDRHSSLAQLMDYMGKDPILIQERLRELVLLSALKEVYYNKDFDSENILKLIQSIALKSKFTEHQKIAKALIHQFTNLQIGTPPPTFKLKSTQGIFKSLGDYKGRYVYLVFLSDNCEACESDLTDVTNLAEKYKKDIAVVGILVNYTKAGLEEFKKSDITPWDRLYFGNNFEILNNYQIKTYPIYMLVDRQGNMLLNPAKKPYEGINRYFDFLIRRDAQKNKKQDDLFR